jgi:hypothetical protein
MAACKEFEQPAIRYYRGHLTPLGLFQLLEENSDATIVLDDVHAVLDEPKALQIFLAALGTPDGDNGARIVSYKRQDFERSILFRGGIIAISNLSLRNGGGRQRPLRDAIESRVHDLEFSPDRDELMALMYDLASRGWQHPTKAGRLSAGQCMEITDFVIAESERSQRSLDLRLLVDKAFPDFWFWSEGETDCHWHTLVRATIHERTMVSLTASRTDTLTAERDLVVKICQEFQDRQERIDAWRLATASADFPSGKSERAFYRRRKEVAVN